MFKNPMFDVIVIGGNLAGTSAGINAAAKGASVALVERNKKPFFPAHCGEGIDEITLETYGLNKIDFTRNKVTKATIDIRSKMYTLESKKHPAIIFDRNRVENELLKKAENEGIKLFLGISMRNFKPPYEIVLDNKKIIKGRIIIDASGISCQVGRRIGMDTKLRKEDIGVCIQSRVKSDFNADTMKFWIHKPYAPFGYAYLFPLNDKLANIGLGITGGQKLDLGELLKNYINDMCGGKYKITRTFRACEPLASPMSRLIKDNVMITGDAARLSNPTTGGGIRTALFSGSLAGMIAGKYIQGEITSLEPYQEAMRSKISMLRKAYARKRKIESDTKYVKAYHRAIRFGCFLNNLVPNLIQRRIEKTLEKDKYILESYK